MGNIFCDSSAIAKRYVSETGTDRIADLTDSRSGNVIYLAQITGVEVVAAIKRRERSASISTDAAAVALANFRREFDGLFRLVEIELELISQAMNLAEKYKLRGYDAVQLAVALEVNYLSVAAGGAITFVSADSDLNAAAVGEHLIVENPNDY